MPSLDTGKLKNGRISIGFGLDGYLLKPKESAMPSQVIIGGGIGGASGVELDGNYLKDDALKQEYMNLTHYLTFPLEYSDDSGKSYAIYKDAYTATDKGHTVGELAYGGAYCPLLGGSIKGSGDSANSGIGQRLTAAETKISEYKASTSNDFIVGCAVNANSILSYFQHFYPNNTVSISDINKLLCAGLINAEILFNFGAGKGRAYRIKVVDSCSKENTVSVMSVFFATKDVKTYCPLAGQHIGKSFSDARNDGYRFPFENTKYNWQSGTIPGFNPAFIRGIADNIKYDFTGSGNLTQFGANPSQTTEAKCRVRFFIDSNKKGDAGQICTTLPDEIYSTNYQDGSEALFEDISYGITLSGDINKNILNTAAALTKFIQTSKLFHYGAAAYIAKPTPGTPFKYFPSTKLVDCSGFVSWVLNEIGAARTEKWQWTVLGGNFPNLTSQKFLPGYKAIKLPSREDIQPGDILVWWGGKGGRHHAGIAINAGDNSNHYGFGNEKRVRGEKAVPGPDPSANLFFRIVKDETTAPAATAANATTTQTQTPTA